MVAALARRGPGRPRKKEMISGAAVYAVLSIFMPKEDAAKLAGYSESSAAAQHINVKPYAVEVADIRKRLADIPNFVSFLDLAVDLKQIKDNAITEKDYQSALGAIKQLSKNMGYEAPLKMEMEARIKIGGAAQIIHDVLMRGITPEKIAAEKERRKRIKEAEFKEIAPLATGEAGK